jgi:N utilization substance protein B
MTVGTRREARERALSLLYEADAKGVSAADVVKDLPLEPDPFAADLVIGVCDHQRELDELIERFAIDWAIDRMPVIDRTVLRMGTYELRHRDDVPTGVILSEAVELAKRYSTEESGRFVNGVLGAVAAEVRPLPSA